MKNTKTTTNKYWENEDAIVTSTANAEIRCFKEAGKIQLYPKYESDGEMKIGKGCVWSTESMDADECVELIRGLMDGLLDSGVESDVFMAAYDAIGGEVTDEDSEPDEDELEAQALAKYNAMSVKELKSLCKENDIEMEPGMKKPELVELLMDELGFDEDIDEVLDEEFEDEVVVDEEPEADVPVDYAAMSLAELKAECKKRGMPSRVYNQSKKALVGLLEKQDAEKVDATESEPVAEVEAEDPNVYNGSWIGFVDGKVVLATVNKKELKAAKELLEFANICVDELHEILDNNMTKSGKNKGKVNYSAASLAIGEWVLAWELDKESENELDTIVGRFSRELSGKTVEEAKNLPTSFMVELVRFIDNM